MSDLSTPDFIHLHCHSEFSISDSMLRIKELIRCAQQKQMPALALTDRNNVYGAIKFYRAARAAGIKPILGCDLSVRDGQGTHQMLLLAQNHQGFKNLCRLLTLLYAEDQRPGDVALDWQRLQPDSVAHLIALSGGHEGDVAFYLKREQTEEALQRARHWQAVFGGRYYFQATALGWPEEALFMEHYHRWGQEYGIASVASNLVCFARREDFHLHEVRCCISRGELLDDPQRPVRHTPEYHFKGAAELAALLPPQLLENAARIAEQCNVLLPLGQNHLPDFPLPPGSDDVNEYLRQQSEAGLRQRLRHLFPDEALRSDKEALYWARLERELQVIQDMGFAGYFLIVMDFIAWAKSQRIPVGAGRGSGAGSLVAYSLSITDIDPLAYDLLFERFLNPERVSMPDFDIDFCMDRRDEVIAYVAQRYGAHRVAQIATHGTMAAKAVIRDVGRALGLPYAVNDRISKMVPKTLNITLEDALGHSTRAQAGGDEAKKWIAPELIQEYEGNREARQLLDIALRLEGLARNVGKHAGGVVIAPEDLSHFSALYSDAAGGSLATQFDKDDIESVGLVKFDFLGLRTLTIIDWAVASINRRREAAGEALLQLEHLPLDDPDAYRLMQQGHTTAVFQLESTGIKRLAERLQPDHFEDVISLVALYRPGPLDSGMVDDFVERKHGRRETVYAHPLLEPILNTTYGTMVYQEQVMQIAQALADYSLGAADELRRAMGKKKAAEMARHRDIFLRGAAANGIDAAVAGSIFDSMAKFAEYGFNKSHSAAYALLTYQTAWLKCHFPAEFMAAVLTADMEHTDKVVRNVEECRRLKLRVLPPCVNRSQYAFSVEDGDAVRFGLGAIKGVGQAAMAILIEEREAHGAFASLADLCRRIDLKKLNRKTLETLISSGAFDGLERNRGGLMARLSDAIALAEQHHRNRQSRQQDMFGLFGEGEALPQPVLVIRAEDAWPDKMRWQQEKRCLGLYLSEHPLHSHQRLRRALAPQNIAAWQEAMEQWSEKERHEMSLAGLIAAQKTIINKRGQSMIFMQLEDESGQLEVCWMPEDEALPLPAVDEMVLLQLRTHFLAYRGSWQWTVQSWISLDEARWRKAKRLQLHIKHSELPDYPLQLQKVLVPAAQQDGLEVRLHVLADDLGMRGRLRLRQRALLNQESLQQLEALLGAPNVLLDY